MAAAFTPAGGISGYYIYPGYGTTTLTNCTVSGNSAAGNGGGLMTEGFGGTRPR